MPIADRRTARSTKAIRRSVSLSKEVDARVKALADKQRRSANQIIEKLIEAGLEAKEAEKRRFFETADRLRNANDPSAVKQAKQELARMIFGG